MDSFMCNLKLRAHSSIFGAWHSKGKLMDFPAGPATDLLPLRFEPIGNIRRFVHPKYTEPVNFTLSIYLFYARTSKKVLRNVSFLTNTNFKTGTKRSSRFLWKYSKTEPRGKERRFCQIASDPPYPFLVIFVSPYFFSRHGLLELLGRS